MKVILLKDVAKVGRRYEIKEVADGYGRNFIIARGLGMVADSKNLAKLEHLKKTVIVKPSFDQSLLQGKVVKLKAKANEEGHLFAGIHREAIVAGLKSQHGITLDPDLLDLPATLKTVGEHQVGPLTVLIETI